MVLLMNHSLLIMAMMAMLQLKSYKYLKYIVFNCLMTDFVDNGSGTMKNMWNWGKEEHFAEREKDTWEKLSEGILYWAKVITTVSLLHFLIFSMAIASFYWTIIHVCFLFAAFSSGITYFPGICLFQQKVFCHDHISPLWIMSM
jgi:hypothetical protein